MIISTYFYPREMNRKLTLSEGERTNFLFVLNRCKIMRWVQATVLCLALAMPTAARDVVTVPADWPLIPSGLRIDDQFRLVGVTVGKRDALSTNINDYNTFVQNNVNKQ